MSEQHIAHGGNIYQASAEYGLGREQFLDFSANINPLGVPKPVRKALLANFENLVHYPDRDCRELTAGIAGYLRINHEQIIAGNGAAEIVFLLFEALQPKKVLIAAPTFSEYARAAVKYGATVNLFRLPEEEGFRLDPKRLAVELTGGIDVVLLCNPNNPTSTLAGYEIIAEILELARAAGAWLIIDEAFIELTSGGNRNSAVRLLEKYPKLFLIRSFTKILAIPGLRLGYGVGDREFIKKLWQVKLPWSINSLAAALGPVLGSLDDYFQRTNAWLEVECGWFYEQLASFPVFKVFEPASNFILVKILDHHLTASLLQEMLARRGVLIRNAANFDFLDEQYFRVAVKDRKSNGIFLDLLQEILAETSLTAGGIRKWG